MIITHSLHTTLVLLYLSTYHTLNAFVYDIFTTYYLVYKVARAVIKYVIPTVRQSQQFHKTITTITQG